MQRIDYENQVGSIAQISQAAFGTFVQQELPERLSEVWCRYYTLAFPNSDIVSVSLDRFSYLFDLRAGRNIAAYGIMGGKNALTRDQQRMAGFPKAEGRVYHRGHMIPHSGHGGTDINLFIQKGAVNVGPFRELERDAVACPGSFYFVRLLYGDTESQRPISMEQGLLLNTRPPKLRTHFFMN